MIMKTKLLLWSVIILMSLSIIYLLILIINPPSRALVKPDFDLIMRIAEWRRNNFSLIELNYTINLNTSTELITGSMTFSKDQFGSSAVISDNLEPYRGTALIIDPIELISFIQNNTFEEYMGFANYSLMSLPCFTTRVFPEVTRRTLLNGELAIVTFIDIFTGYPVNAFIIEKGSDETIAYSEIFLTGRNYELI